MKKTQDIQQYRKDYRNKNRDKLNDYSRMWQINNPEYYKDYARGKRENGWTCPKVTCELCGFVTHKNNLTRHQLSKRCIAITQGFKGHSKYNVKLPSTETEAEEEQVEVDVPSQL